MSEKNEISRKDLPEAVTRLADAIAKEHKFTDTGVGELPKDIYEKHLPEGLTMDTVSNVQKHNTTFLAALTLVNGEAGEKFLKKHKSIAEVSTEVKAGKDVMGALYKAETKVTVPGQNGQPATEKVKHGASKSFYDAYASGPNRGALKQVRTFLSERAEAAAAG